LKVDTSIRKSVRIVIDERFGTHEEVLVFAGGSWLRWLFFILGPMAQAIRLASFRGTFWTKLFGFSYLQSWLLIEILGLISARTVMQNAATTAHINFESLDEFYGGVALRCYVSILGYFEFRFRVLGRGGYQWWEPLEWDLSTWITIVLALPLIVLLLIIRDFMIRSLSIFCRKNIFMGRNLLVAFPEGELGTLKVDGGAFFWLVSFVGNFLICLIGYCFLYNSFGTVNPGWTAVFE
jgi:hypothetical protein